MTWEEFDVGTDPSPPKPASQSYPSKSYGGQGGGQGSWNSNRQGGGGNNWGNKSKFQKRPPQEEGPAELYLPYVVVFNQDMPEASKSLLEGVVRRLDEAGYTLRMGGNTGPEEDFEKLSKRVELHLPWRGFNQKESKSTFNTKNAFEIAKTFSPVYDKFSDPIKAMLARNVRLVLGKELKSPTLLLVTWSADGAESAAERTARTGNVGHVIAMASALRVPVFNLAKANTLERIQQYLSQ